MKAAAASLAIVLLTIATNRPLRAQGRASTPPSQAQQQADLKVLSNEGQVIYSRECASCHGADGTGDGAGPALAGNNALSIQAQVIKRILEGATDKGMDPFAGVLNDHEVSAVATFVRNAWDNTYGVVLETDVKPVRDQLKNLPRLIK